MLKKVVKKHNNDTMCFVCGVDNEAGLKSAFYELEGGIFACIVTPKEIHQSYPGRVHGGVITAMLDETAGRAVNVTEPETWAVTGELTTRYKKPVPYGEKLLIIGKVIKNNRLFFDAEGYLVLPDGQIAATAKGRYVKMKISDITKGLREDQWCVRNYDDDPEYIDIPDNLL